MNNLIKWTIFIIKVISIILPVVGHTFKTIKEEYEKLKEES